MSHKHPPFFSFFPQTIYNVGAHFRNKFPIFLLIILPTIHLAQLGTHSTIGWVTIFQYWKKLNKQKRIVWINDYLWRIMIILIQNFHSQCQISWGMRKPHKTEKNAANFTNPQNESRPNLFDKVKNVAPVFLSFLFLSYPFLSSPLLSVF